MANRKVRCSIFYGRLPLLFLWNARHVSPAKVVSYSIQRPGRVKGAGQVGNTRYSFFIIFETHFFCHVSDYANSRASKTISTCGQKIENANRRVKRRQLRQIPELPYEQSRTGRQLWAVLRMMGHAPVHPCILASLHPHHSHPLSLSRHKNGQCRN